MAGQYRVTEDGRVFSIDHNWRGYGQREMEQDINAHGYLSVRLTIDGRRKRVLVHKLVAEKFLLPRPSSNHQIRHLDGNKLNNKASNLAWGTAKENADDRETHGRTSRGDRHASAIRAGLAAKVPLPPTIAPTLLDACREAEACMSIVEPRSDKAEYLRVLGVLRAAIAAATGAEGGHG